MLLEPLVRISCAEMLQSAQKLIQGKPSSPLCRVDQRFEAEYIYEPYKLVFEVQVVHSVAEIV